MQQRGNVTSASTGTSNGGWSAARCFLPNVFVLIHASARAPDLAAPLGPHGGYTARRARYDEGGRKLVAAVVSPIGRGASLLAPQAQSLPATLGHVRLVHTHDKCAEKLCGGDWPEPLRGGRHVSFLARVCEPRLKV